MTIEKIYKPIENEIFLLKERLKIKEDNNKCLSSILSYISESFGKLIRPALFLFITKLNKSSIDIALSIELLHSASLLHDDVIDGSFLRRNKETVISRWGKNWAVLVGDLFLAKSFEALGNYNMEIIKLFTQAGLFMCKGQMLELEKKESLTENDYLKIIYLKTAHLFELSCKVGALTSNNTNNIQEISDYGKNLGLAFQIIDDCLDIEKDIIENKKRTLPIIRAIKLASQNEKEIIKNGDKDQIMAIVKKYKGKEYSRTLAEKYIKKAKSSIQDLFLPHKDSLISLCDFVLERKE